MNQIPGWLPRFSAAVLAASASKITSASLDEQRAQARFMNQEFQGLLEMRSQQMRDNLQRSRVPTILHANRAQGLMSGQDMPLGYYDQGMVRMASAIGADLAHMHKEAGLFDGLGKITSGIASGMGNIPGMVNSVKKGIGNAATSIKGMGAFSIPKRPLTGGVSAPKATSVHMPSGTGTSAAAKNTVPSSGIPNKAPVIPATPKPAGTPTQQAAAVQAAPPVTPQNQATATKQVGQPPSSATPPVQGPAKPGHLDRLKADMGGGKWKYKLPLLAGAGVAALGAVKGAKGVANWMAKEPAPPVYNSGGVVPPQNVNQYGVPDRAIPARY